MRFDPDGHDNISSLAQGARGRRATFVEPMVCGNHSSRERRSQMRIAANGRRQPAGAGFTS
ncbi:MAG: hypothetical protein ACRELF_00530, partial [Gemmataceae bacterium]